MAGQDMRGPSTLAGGRLFGPVAAALGLILALAPVTVSFDAGGVSLYQATALAKGDNPGEGKGGDRGGNGGGGLGKDKGANANADDKRLKGQTAKDAARNRVNLLHGNADGNGNIGNDHFVLTDGQTQALLQQGWGPKPQIEGDGFDNHGERISTMVHLAKELGYSASVGAMQANFLPADWYDLQAQWRDAETDAERAGIEGQIVALLDEMPVEDWRPGEGPQGDEWATVNLDVDGDGMITEADLLAVQEPGFAQEDETFDDGSFFWPAP